MKKPIFLVALSTAIVASTGISFAQDVFRSTSSPIDNYVYSDPFQDDEEENEIPLLNEEEISEQLKQFRAELDSLKDSMSDSGSDAYSELSETVSDYGETLEEHESLFGDRVIVGHGDQKMTLFGRVHVDWWTFPQHDPGIEALEGEDPRDRFNFRRMRFGVKGDVKDNMFYKIEIEFADGNNPSYRDAFLGFKNLPFFNTLTIGNHKRPYGLDHLNSSRYNVFIERPFIIEAFNQDSRRIGISSRGHSDDERYNWQYGVYHHELTQNTSGFISDHYQPELAGRLAYVPWYDECSGGRGYWHLAVSGAVAFPDGLGGDENAARYRTRVEARTIERWLNTDRIEGADQVTLVGLENVFNVGAFQFVAEYQALNLTRRAGFGDDVFLHGGYLYASYFLTGEHIPWNRKTGTLGRVKPFENFWRVCDCDGLTQTGLGAWQVAVRYSFADLTDEDIIGGVGNAVTFGLNWHWNAYARMQANYIIGDVERDPIGGGDYQSFGTRFMIDF